MHFLKLSLTTALLFGCFAAAVWIIKLTGFMKGVSEWWLSLKHGFGGCGHRFGGCDGLGGLGGFGRFGGFSGFDGFSGFGRFVF